MTMKVQAPPVIRVSKGDKQTRSAVVTDDEGTGWLLMVTSEDMVQCAWGNACDEPTAFAPPDDVILPSPDAKYPSITVEKIIEAPLANGNYWLWIRITPEDGAQMTLRAEGSEVAVR